MVARILLGISGGIAAAKATDLASRLAKAGHEVQVVMTPAATRFVAPLTFEALTRRSVLVEGLDPGMGILHIDLARWPDLVVVAPASADLLARQAAGMADDLLATVLLATTAPVVVVPAMNPAMWQHPATQANVAILRSRGVTVVPPATGPTACGEEGQGRMPEPADLLRELGGWLASGQGPLAGRKVLVTAGGTREPLDAVRFLGNRSSGRMGHALASAAQALGADVTLVTTSPLPSRTGVRRIEVTTAAEMAEATLARWPDADVLVMAAAVADWTPAQAAPHKLKKADGPPEIRLVPTRDILAEAGAAKRPGQLLVGFAAETGDLRVLGEEKRVRKGCDLLIANHAPRAMEAPDNEVVVLSGSGAEDLGPMIKEALADVLWQRFGRALAALSAPS
ncbi:MAG: bifunctional phosphopantothenoylcysteine decarboxylase/phosphopantothenate--cysteine ligase CoaBC [Candidatus Sericytochromatia bacterium]|nr:bifunctional phosphopantothenoylcysteine decarboxylase/phosphopantothenate--cysteine ligase CoaBC [Candidatus Tanganyikabacteria bacterium]